MDDLTEAFHDGSMETLQIRWRWDPDCRDTDADDDGLLDEDGCKPIGMEMDSQLRDPLTTDLFKHHTDSISTRLTIRLGYYHPPVTQW